MKRCSRCGARNNDESNFCTSCGANLNRTKNKNLLERFKDANIIIKVIIIIIAVFVFLVAIAWIGHLLFGMPLESFTEGDATYSQSQFDSLDTDNDGALSFYEVENLASDIPYDNLTYIFDEADKNDNGFLRGAEFDGYLYRIDKYYKDLEKQKKAEAQRASQQKSSSSNPLFEDIGHEICPVCGGDEFTEFYNPEYGEMNWQCDYCGEIYRSDDEFYIDYWQSNGIKSILPAVKNNLAIG